MKNEKRWGWRWEVGDKISEDVFDRRTLFALRDLLSDKISTIDYPISYGKEAVVYKGEGEDGPVAIKIYRPKSAFLFGGMKDYIEDDKRFEKLPLSRKDLLLQAWARKELDNLARIGEAGVPAPAPIAVKKNVLVMSYIGDRERPAPLLKDIDMKRGDEGPDWPSLFNKIKSYIQKMYSSEIVHGDLSEYNLLWWEKELWVIDVGQSVLTSHPMAQDLLKRDVERMVSFFTRRMGAGEEKLGIDASVVLEEVKAKR